MSRFRLHGKVGAGVATVTMLVALGGAIPQPAGADPAFVASYAGVGSDTIQSVMDAFTGAEPYPSVPTAFTNNPFYAPIHSSAATGQKVIASFDATPQGSGSGVPSCIITKLGGVSFDRPDGSSNGINALIAAVNGTGWQAPSASCTGAPVIVSGQIDFARSSRGPNSTATSALTFVPFAKDALSYAYMTNGPVGDITHLTTAQLTSLFSSASGTITSGSTQVKACVPNTGSGTFKFWIGAIGVTAGQATTAATAACGFTAPGLEEHDGNAFFAKKASVLTGANQAAVVAFSAANWIAQANGAQLDRSATARAGGVDLGNPDNSGGSGAKPYSGSGSNLSPNATYYNATSGQTIGTYGRLVYNVVPTTKVSGALADNALKSIFVGTGSAVCSQGATITKFGFLTIGATCGDVTVTGAS